MQVHDRGTVSRGGAALPLSMGRVSRVWLLTLMVLIGAALRIAPLTDNRFHPDEALFATLGRLIVTGRDLLLAHTPLLVDKPPFFYYQLAAGITLSWGSEVSARLPGLFAGVISIGLAARLAWQLWRSDVAAILTALVCALSPFNILFSPTAFADPLMVLWILAALVAITARRWGLAGGLFGLALATKPNALFFSPLVIGLGTTCSVDAHTGWRDVARWTLRFVGGLSMVVGLIAVWDMARAPAISFWAAGVAANNPGRLARSNEVWLRASSWLNWLYYVTASPGLNVALLGLIAVLAPIEITLCRGTRGATHTLVLLSFDAGYAAAHWLVAFPVLDRYLLPLVPLIALLAARAVECLVSQLSRWADRLPTLACLAGLLIAALLARPAAFASRSAYPVGGDHGAYDGIDQIAAYLRALPEGSVVYYSSLGWSLTYYLFDAYIYLAPYASLAALREDLTAFGRDGPTRYLVLPAWESHIEVLDAAAQAGFHAEVVFQTVDRRGIPSLMIYHLTAAVP